MLKHRVARRPHASAGVGHRMIGAVVAVGLLAGPLAVASGRAASAAPSPSAPTVTFAAPSVSGSNATLSFSVNRGPQQISGVVCSLTLKGGTTSSASCGRQTTSSSTKTSYAVTLSSLNAGTYAYGATVKLEDTGSGTGSTSFTIKSMAATCTVTAYNTTYNGSPHTATGTCTGAGGTNLSADLTLTGTTHTNAGTYPGDKWTFTDPTGNYTNPGGTVSDAIGKAAPSCTVTSYSATYNANAHTATGSCTGAGGVNLNADLNLAGTTHTNAGTYATDGWSFTDPAGNYTNPGGTVSDSIGKTAPSCTVTSYSATYDTNAHTATGSCTGVGGMNLSADLNLANTAHTSAGTYPTDSWSFADPAGNYTNASGNVTDAIAPATANCTVTSYSATYDANVHTATGSCTGASGMNLSADLNLSGTMHTSAGTYATDTWSFTDPTGNYTNPGGTVTDAIGQATATCKVTAFSVTYDGNPHTATGSCSGLNGTALPTGDLNLAGTAHTNAGTYPTDVWTFTDRNYTNPGGTLTDAVAQATANCTVTSYSITYDGNTHSATGTCTDVNGAALPSGDLNLAGTIHSGAGTYSTDAWTFSDPTGNYTSPGGTADDSIGQATAQCSVTGYSVPSDGDAHTASGTCTDINGAPLPAGDLDLSKTTHASVGNYSGDTWSFTDPTGNYTNPGGTVTDVITAVIGAQTLSFTSTAPTGAVVGSTPYYTPTATTTATDPGLQVALAVDSSAASVCSINLDGTVSFNGPGTCTIDANQGGDTNYLAATQVQQSFAISVPQAAIPQVLIDYPDNPQVPVIPPNPGWNSCPKQQFPDGGCNINDLDGTVDNTFDATSTDPNPDPAHDTVSYHWNIFYPPIFGIPGVKYSADGITGLGDFNRPAPDVQIAAGSLPQLVGDKKAGGDPYWRAELRVTVNGTTTTSVWFRFIYDSNFPLDFSTNCELFGQFMGLNCAIVASQLLPYGDQALYYEGTPPTAATVGGAPYTPITKSLSGLPVTFSIDPASTAVCSMAMDGSGSLNPDGSYSGGAVSFNAVGTCTIHAKQAGSGDWNPSDTTLAITVGPGT